MTHEYPREQRITQRSEFHKLSREGKRVRTLDLDVRSLASPLGYVRAGVIVPRYGQTAVARNKLKRRLCELVRKLVLPLQISCDTVIRCRPGAYERTFAQLQDQVGILHSALQQKFSAGGDA